MEQITNAIKWLEALKSGKYKQGISRLGDKEQGFCCWGLGCYIVGVEYDPYDTWEFTLGEKIGFLNHIGAIKPHYLSDTGRFYSLAPMNDELKLSFDKIADYLIEHAKTNFIPEVAEAIQKHFNYE